MDLLRISGKDLGYLAMPDFCPRCFWIKRHCTLPYQIFPGIFSSIDSYCKKITWLYHAKHGTLPPWFCENGINGTPLPVLSSRQFQAEAEGVVLTGVIDDWFKTEDGVVIVDYKTAKFTANADALLPIYTVQLNAYAWIAEKLGMGPVKKLWLIYYEPMNGIESADGLVSDDGFELKFNAKCLEIPLDTSAIEPLLRKAKEIWGGEIPASREGCKDCLLVMSLMSGTSIPAS